MMPENGVSTLAKAANNLVAIPTFFLMFLLELFSVCPYYPMLFVFPKFSNFVRTANKSKVSWVDFGKFKESTPDHPQQDTL
jgi:hypothetical protein